MTVEIEAGIVARDAEALCAFYTQVMGFALIERFEHDVGSVYKLRRNAARLKIFHSVDSVDPVLAVEPWFKPGGWRYAALYLEDMQDVDALAAMVATSGGSVLIAPTNHRDGARMALVSDPEGNIWELLAEL
jgi:predicted enzyme related to lactoylglutathione lyase